MRYITRESASLATARSFARRIRAKCEQIAALPGAYGTARPELREGLRSTPFGSYAIFFRYTGDRMEIVNILHASRDVGEFYDAE